MYQIYHNFYYFLRIEELMLRTTWGTKSFAALSIGTILKILPGTAAYLTKLKDIKVLALQKKGYISENIPVILSVWRVILIK